VPDIFLYAGEPNPNDIRLRNPLVSGSSAVIVEGVGSSDGASTALAIGVAILAVVGLSDGVAVASGVSASINGCVGNAAGVGTATGVCSYIFGGVGNASGTCVVLGIGEDAAVPVVPPVTPPVTSGGGIGMGFGDVYHRGEIWNNEIDEDEIIELVFNWLNVK
jgi:hypothetical protein